MGDLGSATGRAEVLSDFIFFLTEQGDSISELRKRRKQHAAQVAKERQKRAMELKKARIKDTEALEKACRKIAEAHFDVFLFEGLTSSSSEKIESRFYTEEKLNEFLGEPLKFNKSIFDPITKERIGQVRELLASRLSWSCVNIDPRKDKEEFLYELRRRLDEHSFGFQFRRSKPKGVIMWEPAKMSKQALAEIEAPAYYVFSLYLRWRRDK